MNVMNNSNIDNRLNPKRNSPAVKKSALEMGQEKVNAIKLKTAPRESEKGSMDKAHPEVAGSSKVSLSGKEGQKIKRKRKSPQVPWKKPEGMPKRPLSAYNLFFQDRRKQIMLSAKESNDNLLDGSQQSYRKSSKKKSGVGFANLARTIGTEWRALPADKKKPYESMAAYDKERYDREMKVWRAKEKELKAMRESNQIVKSQPYGWPTLASMTASTKGFGEDPLSMRKSVTDPGLADLVRGMRTGSHSAGVLQLQDRESRGVFHSSIYGNFNNNASWMDASSIEQWNMMFQQQQRQQDASSFVSSMGLSDKGQLRAFKTPDNLEQTFPFDIPQMGTSSFNKGSQSFSIQNNPFLASLDTGNNRPDSMAWSTQRKALNMDNVMSSSIDLEPLPLPENPHQQQQQEKIFQKSKGSQMGWSSQLGLQQMHGKDQQQQRTTIATDEQYLRRLSTSSAPLFSTGWGQSNSWNTNALDADEPILTPFGGDNVNQELAGKNMTRSSQLTGSYSVEETKSRSNNSRTFPSSSNNLNQDLDRYFDDGQNKH